MIGNGLIPKGSPPGVVMMSQEEYYFLLGLAFTQSSIYTFGSAEDKLFLFDPTNYIPDPGASQKLGQIVSEPPSFFAESGPLEIRFYGAPTLGPATPTPVTPPPFNRNPAFGVSAQLELSLLDQEPTDRGTLFSEILIPATGTHGNSTGFESAKTLPFAPTLDEQIIISVLNTDGADNSVGMRINWYEI